MSAWARDWVDPVCERLVPEWLAVQDALKDKDAPMRFFKAWLKERARQFAIETGQIEGLHTLRRGITEQLITAGFAGVTGAHTLEGVEDRTIRGLLEDQETACNMLFGAVADDIGLTQHKIKSWHQLLTRHQATVTGLTPTGQRVQVPFREKGRWKVISNNPRRPDGVVHQYCPPD